MAGLKTLAVVVTGNWGSPLALMFLPVVMFAGFTGGRRFSLYVGGAAALAVSAQQAAFDGVEPLADLGALEIVAAVQAGTQHEVPLEEGPGAGEDVEN